jgi:hypothetical protein
MDTFVEICKHFECPFVLSTSFLVTCQLIDYILIGDDSMFNGYISNGLKLFIYELKWARPCFRLGTR